MIFNNEKLEGVFDALECPRINILGLGSVGSSLAEMAARLGVKKIALYDFDLVETRNAPNSALYTIDDGRLKVDAVTDEVLRINPNCIIKKYPEGYQGQNLTGIVFLAVDNIELRKKIVENNICNDNIRAMFDIRTSLYSSQGFAADWRDYNQKKDLLNSMQFTHDEVTETRSACGATLGVISTVRAITALQIANFVNFMKSGDIKKFIEINLKDFDLLAM